MLYWFLKSIALGPILRVLFRPRIEGAHHVPDEGAAIVASNHLSFSDSIFLPLALQRRITFPAKMEYFTGRGPVGRLKAFFFRSTGQIPIDRSGGDASLAAMRAGLEVLARGELFGIYPEGTRSPDGRLYRGKTGVARMALQAGVPVIPVAMIDTDKAQPTGQKIPTITRIGVRFGPPLDFSRYAGQADDRQVVRQITDEIMQALATLSGQEYVDEYAATRKQQLAAKAEELVARAKVESASAAAKAEEFVARAKVESASAAAKAEEFVARAKVESASAAAKAEELVATAKAESAARTEQLVVRARAGRHAQKGPVAADPASTERATGADVGDTTPPPDGHEAPEPHAH